MSMLNVRLPNDTEDELDAVAQARGSTKSDIAREAINAYLSGHYMWLRDPDFDGDTDDFSEFGTAVTDALRKILHTLIDGPPENEWDRFVEPLYQVFKERVIAQSLKWGRPSSRMNARTQHFSPHPSGLRWMICMTGSCRSTS
jgi:hypothetical protein